MIYDFRRMENAIRAIPDDEVRKACAYSLQFITTCRFRGRKKLRGKRRKLRWAREILGPKRNDQ